MQQLYSLRDMLCEELKKFGEKEKIDMTALNQIDTLTHAIKNLDKVIEACEMENGGYSNAPMMDDRMSYARGRGINARRDSMGRYSRNGGYSNANNDFRMNLQELMNNAPNDYVRQKMFDAMNGM